MKLICLGGAAILAPFAASPETPLAGKVITGLIALFTTANGFLDKGVANLEAEKKEAHP